MELCGAGVADLPACIAALKNAGVTLLQVDFRGEPLAEGGERSGVEAALTRGPERWTMMTAIKPLRHL